MITKHFCRISRASGLLLPMKMSDSQVLLADYVTNGSEPAFRELVARYIDLVYFTAVRLVDCDMHLAEDVAQTVFVDLARKAHILPRNVMLGGWLHRDTCLVAAGMLRRERRRQSRERQAVEMNALQDHSEANLALLKPVLDEAINQLGADDRTAILLRFFERRDFRSVGEVLGSNEDAAQKRVARALEKLHSLLKRRGVVFSAATLGTALTAETVTAAPAGLAVSIAGTALASVAADTGTTFTLLKLMTMTKLKIGIISAIVVAGVTTPLVIQHRAQVELHDENESLRQQLGQLQIENERLSNLAAHAQVNTALSNDQLSDLLRLRREAGLLHQQTNELVKLREENRQFRAKQNSQMVKPPSEELTPRYFPKESWTFVGYDTPEAAFQSSAWAGSHGKIKVYLNTLTPELRDGMRQELESKSESVLAEEIGKQTSATTGYTVLNKEVVSDDEVVLTISMGNDVAKIRMKKNEDEWKYAGPVLPNRN